MGRICVCLELIFPCKCFFAHWTWKVLSLFMHWCNVCHQPLFICKTFLTYLTLEIFPSVMHWRDMEVKVSSPGKGFLAHLTWKVLFSFMHYCNVCHELILLCKCLLAHLTLEVFPSVVHWWRDVVVKVGFPGKGFLALLALMGLPLMYISNMDFEPIQFGEAGWTYWTLEFLFVMHGSTVSLQVSIVGERFEAYTAGNFLVKKF